MVTNAHLEDVVPFTSAAISTSDDTIYLTERQQTYDLLAAIELESLDLNQQLTTKVHADPMDASYCSSYFIPVLPYSNHNDTEALTNFVLTPKPGRVLYKMSWTVFNFLPKQGIQWLRSVAIGASMQYAHVPIVATYVAKLLTLTRTFAGKPVTPAKNPEHHEWRHLCAFAHVCTQETIDWFCHKYDTTPEEILTVEHMIMAIQSIPCYLSHPLIDRMYQVDVLD
jgi:hypothetical protein